MPLAPGTRLGPYQIVAALGAGGMGEVYRARDTRLRREVAVKILRAGGTNEAALLRRLEQEAQTLAALNHPNLLAIHDVGEHAGSIFLVTELLDGETLRARLQQGRLGQRRALDYARQLAQGLAAAHAAGVVHRDLKPENIMLTGDGRLKILDFGLARSVLAAAVADDAETLTSPPMSTVAGTVLGTVGYMAPEQVRGEAAGAAADIFAFGAIVYEMLAGRRAFQAQTTAETMTAILREDPPEIAPGEAGSSLAVDRIVRRCLEKDPRQRFQSAADLDFALAALSDTSSTSLNTPANAAARKPGIRSWRTAAWIAITAVITAAVCALFMLDRGAPTIPATAYRPLTFFGPAANFAPVWSADGRALAYAASGSSFSPQQVFTYRLGEPSPQQLTHMPENSVPLEWSADGRSIVFAEDAFGSPSLWSIAAVGGEPQHLMDLGHLANTEAITAQGKVLAAVMAQPDGKLGVAYSSPMGAPLRWYQPAPFSVAAVTDFPALAFSPDGHKLLLSTPDAQGPVRTWILPFPPSAAAPPRQVLPNLPPRNWLRMGWMPDGRHILITAGFDNGDATLWQADPGSGRMQVLATGIPGGYLASISAQGNALAVVRALAKFNIVSADVRTAAVTPLIASAHNQSMPAWAQDAPGLVYVSDRGGTNAIWIHEQSANGSSDRELVSAAQMGGPGSFQLPALSPHAHRVAFTFDPVVRGSEPQPNKLWLASVAGGPAMPLTAASTDYQMAPCWSPDGSEIAYLSSAGARNRLMAVASAGGANPRILVPQLAPANTQNSGPAWSPDGKWIAFAADMGQIALIAPDGSGEHTLTTLKPVAWTFSADSRALYAAVKTGDTAKLVSISLATGAVTNIGSLGAYVPNAWIFPGVHLTLGPGGQFVTYNTGSNEEDLDLVQPFTPYGRGMARLRHWLKLP